MSNIFYVLCYVKFSIRKVFVKCQVFIAKHNIEKGSIKMLMTSNDCPNFSSIRTLDCIFKFFSYISNIIKNVFYIKFNIQNLLNKCNFK